MEEIDAVKNLLREANTWFRQHMSLTYPAQSLRTPILRPDAVLETDDRLQHRWGTVSERVAVVQTLAAQRAERLREQASYPEWNNDQTPDGRVLICYPDVSLADGAARQVSHGYFDLDNTPPWDTWLVYVHDEPWRRILTDRLRPEARHGPLDHDHSYASYLVSWVPPQLGDVVEEAVWANPEQCLAWANDVDTAFTRQLRTMGLLSALTW